MLVDFAVSLMTILDQINRESFQRFKLRLGKFLFLIKFIYYYLTNTICQACQTHDQRAACGPRHCLEIVTCLFIKA